jgi:hypothetical protein
MEFTTVSSILKPNPPYDKREELQHEKRWKKNNPSRCKASDGV